jgi:predicted PurR-regulated permease PerM
MVCFSIAVVMALVFFVIKTRFAITLTLSAALVSVALNHVVVALMKRGVRREWAIVMVVGGMLTIGVGLGFLLVPPAVAQAKALVVEAPNLWQRLEHSRFFEILNARFDLKDTLRQSGSPVSAAPPLLNVIGGVLSLIGGLISLLFLAVFMLIFGGDLVHGLLVELSTTHRDRYERIAEKVYHSVGGYLVGLLGICSLNATLTTTFLAIIRMPYFLPLGIISGTSSLIPYAGPLVTGTAITLMVLATAGLWKALAAAGYFVLYGQLEGNVVGPLVYRRTVHVNPLITLLSILFLAEFMGLVGAIVAVPVAAAAQIVVREWVAAKRGVHPDSPAAETPLG